MSWSLRFRVQVQQQFLEEYAEAVAYTNANAAAAEGLIWILIDRVRYQLNADSGRRAREGGNSEEEKGGSRIRGVGGGLWPVSTLEVPFHIGGFGKLTSY